MERLQTILDIYSNWAEDILGQQIPIEWHNSFGAWVFEYEEGWKVWIGMIAHEDDILELPLYFANRFETPSLIEIPFHIIAFLHEIGHLKTWDEDYQNEEEKAIIRKNLDWVGYRLLLNEEAADLWAADYMLNHSTKMRKYIKLLEQAYRKVTFEDLQEYLEIHPF